MPDCKPCSHRLARWSLLRTLPPCKLALALTMLLLLFGARASDDWMDQPDQALLSFSGALQQGGLLIGQAPSGSQVELDGSPLQLSEQGQFLMAFERDRTSARKLQVTLPDGRVLQREFTPEPRQFNIQRIDNLPPDKVTAPPELLERIREEGRQSSQARLRRDPREDWAEGFSWPVTGRITGVYGSQRILNGEPKNPHWGLDIAAPTGTPVKAPAPGIVTLAHPDMYYSGGTLFIDHGHGLVSAFLHLSALHAKVGDRVERGTIVAEVGATGRATGPHLDWRMNLGPIRIDPALLVNWEDNPHAGPRR